MVRITQARNNEILLNNAYESWVQAIKNARNIKNGLVTLQYKKAFVSNLHNAVELFLKQLMLNQQDYRIATVKVRRMDSNGNPLKNYYQATNLNQYFKNLLPEERKVFISIEFNELIDIHRELLQKSLNADISYNSELKLLQSLRNNEIHFYIEAEEFLNESEFVKLHNFMCDFNQTLEQAHLFPFIGTPLEEEELLCFDDIKLDDSSFSFRSAVENSGKAKKISQILNGQIFDSYVPPYGLTQCFEKIFIEENIFFDEALSYIESLMDYGWIDIQEEYANVENERGEIVTDFIGYMFICKL